MTYLSKFWQMRLGYRVRICQNGVFLHWLNWNFGFLTNLLDKVLQNYSEVVVLVWFLENIFEKIQAFISAIQPLKTC